MIIYGRKPVFAALEQGRIKQLYLVKGSSFSIAQNVAIQYVSKDKLDEMANHGNHQGIVAVVKDYQTHPLQELTSGKHGLIVMLDGLEDPHNLGAILRTGDCIGIDGIIYKKHHAVSLNATVAKVSTGAIETVKVCEVANLTQTLKELKKQGYWIVGTDVEKAGDYRSYAYDTKLVLVIGSEGKGISRLVKQECDYLVKLPMVGTIQSLNASVAAGILLYHIYDKRHPFTGKK